MSSQQKVVVIAGASQGIGASLVKGFCQIGYAVVANSRSMRKIDARSGNRGCRPRHRRPFDCRMHRLHTSATLSETVGLMIKHFGFSDDDVVIHPLPMAHMGGLMILLGFIALWEATKRGVYLTHKPRAAGSAPLAATRVPAE